ncbi:MAG: helix-turn-helix transcriptional regulator [Peptococcia bacterium]|jgi:predicted DNA-binding transcriptional regulator YafY
MSNVSQVERQLYIFSMLSENSKGFTIEEVLNNLRKIGGDVSCKTIKRDIDCITKNFFVYEEKRNNKTVYLAKKYKVQNVTFSISELISLYFAREVLNFYSGLEVGSTATKIIEKIIASTPKINRNYLDTLNNLIKVNVIGVNQENKLDSAYLKLLKNAIEENRCVRLEYYSFYSDEITEREFEPYLLEIYEGCWHAIGYCRLRKSFRDLRVSRIKSLKLTNEVFNRPKYFYEDYKKNRFDKLSGEEKVCLRLLFTGQAARFIEEYESSKADSLQRKNDGLLFERTVAMSPEILKWVLNFGAEVKVLEPIFLRERVQKEIKKMNELYYCP